MRLQPTGHDGTEGPLASGRRYSRLGAVVTRGRAARAVCNAGLPDDRLALEAGVVQR